MRSTTFYWDYVEESFLFLWSKEQIYKSQRLASLEKQVKVYLWLKLVLRNECICIDLMIFLAQKLNFYAENWF